MIGADHGPELAVVMAGLRVELADAAMAASTEQLRFAVQAIHVELSLAVERSATAKSGVKFWVIEAGAEAGLGRTASHTVSFDLAPTNPDGSRADVYISGQALQDEE